jgi:hypothetical protein
MSLCGVLGVAAGVAIVAAVITWVTAAVTYVLLLRRTRGGWSLVTSSLWVFRPGSLGPAAEPLRRRLLMLFGLFLALVVVAIAISAGAAANCG